MLDTYVQFLTVLSIGIILLIGWQGRSRKIELFSLRNLYLIGFFVFQLKSGISALRENQFAPYKIFDPLQSAQTFALYAGIFVLLFLFSYHKLPVATKISCLFRTKQAYGVKDHSLLLLAVAFSVTGLLLKVFGSSIPGLRLLFSLFTLPICSVACGLVGWVWGNRRFNMFVLSVGCAVFLLCMYTSLTNSFGRRGLTSICLAVAWGAYFRMGVRLKPKKVIFWLIPIALGATFFVGSFTAVRKAVREGADVQTVMRLVFTSGVKDSFGAVASHSGDGKVAIWAIDAFPDRHEIRPLFSLKYMLYHPIPRVIWPDKPLPLSKLVASHANIQGVNQSVVTVPPGVIGYAAAEGGLYALLIYALFYGQFIRFFDEIVRCNPGNPFLILPVGCALGESLGLARGDIAIFGNIIFLGFISTWFFMFIAQKFIASPITAGALPARAP